MRLLQNSTHGDSTDKVIDPVLPDGENIRWLVGEHWVVIVDVRDGQRQSGGRRLQNVETLTKSKIFKIEGLKFIRIPKRES